MRLTSTEALEARTNPKDGLLVIGLVAQVGTNLDDLVDALSNRLKKRNYSPTTISLSKYLAKDWQKATTRNKQSNGTKLREQTRCQHILALLAVAEIHKLTTPPESNSTKRHAIVIRSLKRPEEVHALRSVYGDSFIAIGVHTPKSRRKFNLIDLYGDNNPETTLKCDESDGNFYTQQTRDTFEMCDFFISGLDPQFDGLDRVLKLFFGSLFTTPTRDEYAMYMAYVAALRSADLSRQVGASILNRSDEVVALGANEVPRFGGGQPWEGDLGDDRDFLRGKDSNIEKRTMMIDSLMIGLNKYFADLGIIKFDIDHSDKIEGLLKEAGWFDITEYGRTIHGEMACLISCLRNKIDVFGALLACTTFPCHNCTRHLIGSGIARVIYIEPYPKSEALQLYGDSCSFWDDDFDVQEKRFKDRDPKKFRIEPFIGVGPRKYVELFGTKTPNGRKIERKDKKSGSALLQRTLDLQDPKWPASPFGVRQREEIAESQLVFVVNNAKFPVESQEILDLIRDRELSEDDASAWKQHLDVPHDSVKNEAKNKESAAEAASKSTPPKRGRPPKSKSTSVPQEQVK